MDLNETDSQTISLEQAIGKIEFTLTDNLVFHFSMQRSKNALKGLVSSLKGIPIGNIVDVVVENPITLNDDSKTTIMDLLVTLNTNEIINIELQMYNDSFWLKRSLLYLSRAYDSIGEGDNYKLLKKTTFICITDQDLFKEYPEFYSHYLLTNTNKKFRNYYSTDFGINVLNLRHTDIATKTDINNKLLLWAKVFKATTWEDLRALSEGNPIIREVSELVLEMNTDKYTKGILEGKRRYRELMATYQAEAEEAQQELQSALSTIAEKDSALAKKDSALAEKDSTIAEKNSTIAEMDLLLQKYKEKYGDL